MTPPTGRPSSSAIHSPRAGPASRDRRSSASWTAMSAAKLGSSPYSGSNTSPLSRTTAFTSSARAAARGSAPPCGESIAERHNRGVSISLDPGVLAFLGGRRGALRARRAHLRAGAASRSAASSRRPSTAAWRSGPSRSSRRVDTLAEDLLSFHMAQHLLLAELGAPLILVGIRAPVIFFFLPRPAMVALARRKTLRRVMRQAHDAARGDRDLRDRPVRLALRAARSRRRSTTRSCTRSSTSRSSSSASSSGSPRSSRPAAASAASSGRPATSSARGWSACSSAWPSSPCARPPTTGTWAGPRSTASSR